MNHYPEIENTNEEPGNSFFSEETSLVFIIISFLIFAIGIVLFIFFGSWDKSNVLDEAKVGQFGDFIGGVTGPILSFVGIILFYVALREQRKDMQINQKALSLQVIALNQQIDEFKEQRKELESTRKLYEQQTKTMRVQQFDSSFYSLLNVFIQLKNSLNSNTNDYFQKTYNDVFERAKIDGSDTLAQIVEKANQSYTEVFLLNRSVLSHYFKTLYRLLRVISDCNDFSQEEQKLYSKIVRSQITDNEILILYYNLRSDYGIDARQVMLRFDILKHIRSLSKVEFKRINIHDENQRVRLTVFNEWLENFISISIAQAIDIESDSFKAEKPFDILNIIVGIYIDELFELVVFVDNSQLSSLPFAENEFSMFIELLLYNNLFLNKLRSFSENQIVSTVTKEDEKTNFKFTTHI